jgi:hypothetical protein
MIRSAAISRFVLVKGRKRPATITKQKNMKTTIKITTGLALTTLLAGCVVTSVYPFYTAKDVRFDSALVGAWAETGSTNAANKHWRFEKAEGQAYKLTVQDKEKRTEFDAHLFTLKGRRLLDLYPRERPDNSLPPHYLLKVTRIEPALEMQVLDYDWLTKLVEKNPKAIRHIVVPPKLGENGGGLLVLTADTAELQKFILKHEKTAGAFGDGFVMQRWNN